MMEDKWLEAQYSVLGSVLISPEVAPKVISETGESDYTGTCKTVYKAIRKLFMEGTAVDPVAVSGLLGSNYRDFLVQLMQVTPTAANVDHYIALCREQARVTSVRSIAQKMLEEENYEKLRTLLESANGVMVERPTLKIVTMEDALHSFMDRHTRDTKYLTWPIRDLNEYIYAEPGDMIIFGGYPSTGKSAWALQCAWHWARDHKVGFFSLETSEGKLFDRQMAAAAQLSMDTIKRNQISKEEWDRIGTMSPDIISRNLEIIPAAGMTPADVRATTIMRGYQIIFVDYLQLLQGQGDNRTAQVTAISIALHTMAQSLGVTVVALSQLARQGKGDGALGMSALRESGQIEQDADVIMLLEMDKRDKLGINRKLRTAKNKEGMCPSLTLALDGKHQTFSKAVRTGETLSALTAAAKRTRQQNRQAAQDTGWVQEAMAGTATPF